MNSISLRISHVILGLSLALLSTVNVAMAAELKAEPKKIDPKTVDPTKVDPKTGGVITSPGKKGGPTPPPDPQCPIGSSPVGPITHETYSRACKVKGQSGTQSCYNKTVTCLSGPGEPQTASTENCGACIPTKGGPGQIESPTGR